MPLARRVAANAAASTAGSKSIVATTGLRRSGSATNGVVAGFDSAQPYSSAAERPERAAAQARPPCASSHSTWFASSQSVATDGVL